MSPFISLLNPIEEAVSSLKTKSSADSSITKQVKNKFTQIFKEFFMNVDCFYFNMAEF